MQNTILFGITIIMFIFIPITWRLAIVLWSSIFQIYIWQVAGIYPPFTLLTSILLSYNLFRNIRLLMLPPIWFFMLLLGVHTISLLWSPSIYLGIRNITYLLPFPVLFVVSYSIAKQKAYIFRSIFTVFSLFALIEAVLVILFRLNPSLEFAFLNAPYAQYFIGPKVLTGLFSDARNNVLDPLKAGGLFVNGNVAACFLGAAAFITWGVGKAYKSNILIVSAFLLWVSVFFTGSKMGIVLALFLPFSAYFLLTISYRRLMATRFLLFFLFLVIIYVWLFIVYLFYGAESDVFQKFQFATNVRFMIWSFAWREFLNSPLLGQGFGGWQKSFPSYAYRYGLGEGWPPHNTIIYLWSQSGLLAVILGLLFMIEIMRFGWRALSSDSQEVQALGIGTTYGFLWVFIQGMGENFGIVGDLHILPVLAIALGLTYARYWKHKRKGRVVNARSVNLSTPTI